MKRFFVLLSIVGLIFASDLIQYDKVENLAQKFVNEQFGSYYLDEVITYYGIDDGIGAYAMIFRNRENEPLTIVMGAKYTASPIGEISKVLPRSKAVFDKVLQKARTLADCEPEFQKIYYFGPGEEYCAFNIGDKDILINACTFRSMEKTELMQSKPDPNQELESLLRQKWERYFKTANFCARQDSGYIPGVPFIDWVYGCTPTAASMILWYWDNYAPNSHYGRLVDHFYTHWDYPEDEWNDCANVNRELALAMYTDTMTGGTSIGNIRNGMITVANTWNGYACTGSTSPQGGSWNQYQFSWIKTEINAARPFHWNILYYWYAPFNDLINHSVTGIGYHIILPDTFVQVHNTWDGDEPLWPLWTYYGGVYSYDYVVTFIPGGGVTDNIWLDWPLGGDLYTPKTIFKDIKYRVRWHSQGSNIDHIKLWYSTGRDASGYDSLQWTLIHDNLPNTGEYIWTCPDDDTLRINLSALNSSNTRLAADGSFGRCVPMTLDHSSGIALVGHIPIENGLTSDIHLYGNYLFIADGENGLFVADISDLTIPDIVGDLLLPGQPYCFDVDGSYLYLGDKEDTLRVISISTPTNPVQLGVCAVNDEALDVVAVDTLVFVAARSQGLVIVNVSNPSVPSIIGQYNTTGFSYDLFVDGDYVYVADATKGVRIINVSDPENPYETGYYDTNGISYGLTKSGNYVYVADGTQGIKIFDASSPDTLVLLGSLDTPATATKVQIRNAGLFVADGSMGGIRVIDVSNSGSPSEIGYIDSRGAACNLRFEDSLIYLADGNVGALIIDQDIVGIIEHEHETANLSVSILPTHVCVNTAITISFNAVRSSLVQVKLFDCTGRCVQTIYNGAIDSGNNTIHWQPKNISAGIYFVQTEVNNLKNIHKLVLVK